jgi:hypothetical protein
MSDTIRICWAYNQQAQRCDMPAGHPGNHAISIEWSDEETFEFMPIPTTPTPPSASASAEDTLAQVARAEAKWDNRDKNIDHEALAELDFGRPAEEPTLQDEGRCVACEHKHQSGKCRCGCETWIPRLS